MNFKFHDGERIGVFIDAANTSTSLKAISTGNNVIDFKELLKFFESKGRLLRILYYTAELEGYSRLRPMLDWLEYNGFAVVTKMAKEFTDSLGQTKIKGDMDMEIAVDMMNLAPHLDHIVLFSGDGDFRYLVESLQRKGLRVTVVSTAESKPAIISADLRRQADVFVELGATSFVRKRKRPFSDQPSFERVSDAGTPDGDLVDNSADDPGFGGYATP